MTRSASRSWPSSALEWRDGQERSDWNRPHVKVDGQMESDNINLEKQSWEACKFALQKFGWCSVLKVIVNDRTWESIRSTKDEVKAAKIKCTQLKIVCTYIYVYIYIYTCLCIFPYLPYRHATCVCICILVDINLLCSRKMSKESCEVSPNSPSLLFIIYLVWNSLTEMVSCRREAI